jgi:hypothetical protein
VREYTLEEQRELDREYQHRIDMNAQDYTSDSEQHVRDSLRFTNDETDDWVTDQEYIMRQVAIEEALDAPHNRRYWEDPSYRAMMDFRLEKYGIKRRPAGASS